MFDYQTYTNLIGCHGNQKAEFAKNIQKSTQKLYGR